MQDVVVSYHITMVWGLILYTKSAEEKYKIKMFNLVSIYIEHLRICQKL